MMFDVRIVSCAIVILLLHSSYGSYHYVGCYKYAFHDTYFSSSYMEPNLCFRLCGTPVIYLQKEVCRCSGSGLMDYNREKEKKCQILCANPDENQLKTSDTCGGKETYSAYVEDEFFHRHSHLFDYRIQFRSCQLWNNTNIQNTLRVTIYQPSEKSPLTKLERCAAACLDKNRTVKLLAFNDDSDQCSCVLSKSFNENSSYNTCDRYCDNILDDSNIEHRFRCGSQNDSRIWALYDLDSLCPADSVYVKQLKKCLSTYRGLLNFCSSSSASKRYLYDGNITWPTFLKIIDQLNLTKSFVSIDFDARITVDPIWKCSSTTTNSSIVRDFNTNYLLNNGCLHIDSSKLASRVLLYRLCMTNPINEESILFDFDDYYNYKYENNIETGYCPKKWLDLNRNCYRISNIPKSISEARNSCISLTEAEEEETYEEIMAGFLYRDDDEDKKKEIDQRVKKSIGTLLRGNIVQYTSSWQVRLGFFLLNTSINEFQMINTNDNSCLLFTNSTNNIQIKNCSTPKYVLCRTDQTDFYLAKSCFRKPLTLGLPTIVSNHLTHELCLSICDTLKTNLAVLNMNRCYCINTDYSWSYIEMQNLEKYTEKDCGNICPGNQFEYCGNESIVVILNIGKNIIPERYGNTYKLVTVNPDFVYDSCIYVNTINSSSMYEFGFINSNDIHPRHCLELCSYYQQKYALLNLNKCLCTNVQMRTKRMDILDFAESNCTQTCPGNYFYTCGNISNSSMYSMYVMQPKCPPGFEVIEDERRCVHTDYSIKKSSFSLAQSYCKSIGGMLAKMNDIEKIQDMLPRSILNEGTINVFSYLYLPHLFNDTRYFWIHRVYDNVKSNIASDRTIRKCLQTFQSTNRNCIVLRYEKILTGNVTSYQRCFTESNECSSILATPICVDQHMESYPSISPLPTSIISVNTSIDYSCGDNKDYHLIDQYCYKVDFHETTWLDAKTICERDNAILFLPEKTMIVQMIKELFLRRHSYTSSGVAHIGAYYDHLNRTVIKYNTKNGSMSTIVSDSDALQTLCRKTFVEHYERLLSSPFLSSKEKNELKHQQTGCAYADFRSDKETSISCDEIPCNRLATIICQKMPIRKIHPVIAKNIHIRSSKNDNDEDIHKPNRTINIRFASILFMLVIGLTLVFSGLIALIRKRRLIRKKDSAISRDTSNKDLVYSELLNGNDIDSH